VIIYPINTQGVPSRRDPHGAQGRFPTAIGIPSSKARLRTLSRRFAIGTGGEAIRLKSNFGPELERVEAATRAAYLIAYVPEGNPDGPVPYHQGRVLRKGVKVRAKDGLHVADR
jgi:hypothetical protein